jgi:hypothetical protein
MVELRGCPQSHTEGKWGLCAVVPNLGEYKYLRTKIWLFNTNVKSILLYRCETWKITEWISNSLQAFVN